jgi:hypothetical protein
MKYWGYLAAKLLAAAGVAYAVLWAIHEIFPPEHPLMLNKMSRDFNLTFVMLLFFLFCLGLLYFVILDQRYRCRTCLRRLRMPIAKGSWTHVLLGPPRTEYICPYGHGTLRVPDLQVGGPHLPDWQKHDEDIWKELFPVEESKK